MAVGTNQRGIHPKLAQVLQKHLENPFRKPVAEHTREAFAGCFDTISEAASVLLDAGCGTGESTLRLARRHPESLVIGVDKSMIRLKKKAHAQPAEKNALLVRADLVDWWQLSLAHGVKYRKTYLLYPNPWPKAIHLKRRWHAHPIFPTIVGSTVEVELRTNWQVYADEFCAALGAIGHTPRRIFSNTLEPVSPFERKYRASGHKLHRVDVRIEANSHPAC